jgi:hypothetical protein
MAKYSLCESAYDQAKDKAHAQDLIEKVRVTFDGNLVYNDAPRGVSLGGHTIGVCQFRGVTAGKVHPFKVVEKKSSEGLRGEVEVKRGAK